MPRFIFCRVLRARIINSFTTDIKLGLTIRRLLLAALGKNSLVIRASFQPALSALPVPISELCLVSGRYLLLRSGNTFTDFKNGTVLFTVELRTTDRPSPFLHRLSSASSVKEPLVSTTRNPPKAPYILCISTDSVHFQSICPTPQRNN